MQYEERGAGCRLRGISVMGIALCALLAIEIGLPVKALDDGFTVPGGISFTKSTTFDDGSVFIGDGNDSLFVDRHWPGVLGSPDTYTLTVDSTTHSVDIDLRTGFPLAGTGPSRFTVIGGSVGFGTETPESRLHVAGSVVAKDTIDGGVLRISDGNKQEMVLDGNQIETTEDPLYLNARTTNGVILALLGGNVGIGTSNPAYVLDVAGVGRFTKGLTIGAYKLPSVIGHPAEVLGVLGDSTVAWIAAPGDNWGSQTVYSSAPLSGDGTPQNPLSLAQQGAAPGQALVWSGASWIPGDVGANSGGTYWSVTGNSGGSHFLGTTDAEPLEIRVNGIVGFEVVPCGNLCPNVIGGTLHHVPVNVSGVVVGGGTDNWIFASNTTIGGGSLNVCKSAYAVVGGGQSNSAGGELATVSGGYENEANGPGATVCGGKQNTASGIHSTALGGWANTTTGAGSLVAGSGATAIIDGSFVWADRTLRNGEPLPFAAVAANEFAVRATGGVRLVTAVDPATGTPTSGVILAAGAGAWSALSDRALKANVTPISGLFVLERLSAIPVTEWNMTAQDPSIRHVGPMAQDFYQAFGLGESDRYINSSDADGIALVAIQALYTLNLEKDKRISELEQQLATFDARLAALEEAVGRLNP